ncbi:zinc dependent phospholipase C family protein [Breznakiellaceae bacterium SP9]
MPSQILHILFGEDVLCALHQRLHASFGLVADKALEKIQKTYQKAFSLGCQGPDIFYHSQNRRPVGLEYGTLLHRRNYGGFTSVLLKTGLPDPPPDHEDIIHGRREKSINALGAYALGFMTHAILDRTLHPYIVYKSFRLGNEKTRYTQAQIHTFFERVIDVLMLKELRNIDISSWQQEQILVSICENPPLGLKELLVRSLKESFPERAGVDTKLVARIENTFLDCTLFYRKTNPSSSYPASQITPSTAPYLFPRKLPSDIDFLNLKKSPWQYPLMDKPDDTRSFLELYADAIRLAVLTFSPLISRYLSTGLFPIADAAACIGNACLSLQNAQGKPCAPSCTDPLPLEAVLEEQAAKC